MRPATVATRWERMLAISLVRVVRGCRRGMYKSRLPGRKENGGDERVWKDEGGREVEEQSREVACLL
jgi:hypothetical protein